MQTNDVNGPRGLSQILAVAFPSEPRKIVGYKNGKPIYEKNQGEHMVVTSETSGKVADLAGRAFKFDDNGNIIGYKEGYDRKTVKAELLKIAKANAQILVPHSFSKTMDAGPGKQTSSAGLNRDNYLTNEQRAMLFSVTNPTQNYTSVKIEIAIEEELEAEVEVIAEENKDQQIIQKGFADIYTKNSEGITSKAMIADFDETMWSDSENVIIAKNPLTGQEVSIAAEDFHKVVRQYEKDGWTFNFDDFAYVKGGKRGPYFDRAVRFIKEEGLDTFSILTARQPEAALSIAHTLHAELVKDGITEYTVEEILEKITGLGVGGVTVTGPMKAKWILDNIVSNGFNKIEVADDGTAVIIATDEMFNDLPEGTVDGTSILVTPEFKDIHNKFSEKTNSETFNIFVEETSGIARDKRYSNMIARFKGRKSGRFNNLVPYSAEDFKGLLYQFLG